MSGLGVISVSDAIRNIILCKKTFKTGISSAVNFNFERTFKRWQHTVSMYVQCK